MTAHSHWQEHTTMSEASSVPTTGSTKSAPPSRRAQQVNKAVPSKSAAGGPRQEEEAHTFVDDCGHADHDLGVLHEGVHATGKLAVHQRRLELDGDCHVHQCMGVVVALGHLPRGQESLTIDPREMDAYIRVAHPLRNMVPTKWSGALRCMVICCAPLKAGIHVAPLGCI